jgi:aryl-alcohol dehydrogenase-like predicted oxidoreductase
MIDWHQRTGAAAIPYSAQARGYFDKLKTDSLDAVTARNYDNPANRARGGKLGVLARRYGLTPTEAMLALFSLAPFPVVPVVGCRDAVQIASSFRGIGTVIAREDAADLLKDFGFSAPTATPG